MRPDSKYESGDYLRDNPTWDIEDSPWKAKKVLDLISRMSGEPESICEVGCGSGGVLAELRKKLSKTRLTGFDIADASSFWKNHKNLMIDFYNEDFLTKDHENYDLILLLDVLEHIPNPWDFLEKMRFRARNYIFHIPLDLSAQSVIRESPIIEARRRVGHIHYFSKNLAIEILQECGYKIQYVEYSGLSISGPRSSWKSRFAYVPRRLMYFINKDMGVRILGGESLFIIATNNEA